MSRIALIALVCFVFLAGCQNAPETGSQPTAPAAAETPAVAPEAPTDTAAALETPAAPDAVPAESAGEAGNELQTGLAHHNFVLETVDGQDFSYPAPEGVTPEKPNLSFGQWPHASGKICNNYSGQAELDGDTLYLKSAASTMKLCFAEELNKFEGLFHQMMAAGVKVSLDGQTLTLTGGDHVLIFKLRDYVS